MYQGGPAIERITGRSDIAASEIDHFCAQPLPVCANHGLSLVIYIDEVSLEINLGTSMQCMASGINGNLAWISNFSVPANSTQLPGFTPWQHVHAFSMESCVISGHQWGDSPPPLSESCQGSGHFNTCVKTRLTMD